MSSRADMEKHVKFRNGEQKKFIESALSTSGLSSKELSKLVFISPRNFRDWKIEKLSMTSRAVKIITKLFNLNPPEDIDKLEKRWMEYKSEKGKIGGYAFKRRYGNPATVEGRKKGGKRALEILREKGIIPPVKIFLSPKKSKKLAEFVGIMLGDGYIGKEQIEITLNSIVEVKYSQFVSNLCGELFGSYPKITKKKDCNAFSIGCYGVNLIKYLTKLGLKTGNKVKQQVGVPLWIMSNREFSKMCCRGLIDTDGCIAIHRYYVGKKRYFYKKLIFTNHSIPLAEFVYNTLTRNGMNPKMFSALEKRRVWLYNSSEVQKYLNLIGTNNEKLLRFKEMESDSDGRREWFAKPCPAKD